jgi:ABC-type antimicrobial peptide transport system permease subunit
MDQFTLYFQIGREHILDFGMGLDHILFVFALAASYQLGDWKKILVLVTAFTIGHSITLALATLHIIEVRTDMVEFFIVVTIFIAAVSNLFQKAAVSDSKIQINYVYALFFGLIHGLGFSNTLRALLAKNESITTPLLAFNLGLEFGQIIIVLIFLIAGFVAVSLLGIARRDWKIIVSSAIAGMAILILKERVFW